MFGFVSWLHKEMAEGKVYRWPGAVPKIPTQDQMMEGQLLGRGFEDANGEKVEPFEVRWITAHKNEIAVHRLIWGVCDRLCVRGLFLE